MRLALAVSLVPALHAQFPVTRTRYDNAAPAANPRETTLRASNINRTGLGKLYSYYVDGAVYAQPLYLPAVPIAGSGSHNVLYVATMNDKLYAFDADKPGPPLWMRSFVDELAGITPVPVTDITNNNDLNLVGNVGIEGTPVIDPPSHAIFLVARTRESGKYLQRIHKIDLRDGRDKLPPVVIEAAVPGAGGSVAFDPKAGNQRPALALANGAVIVAWASHEDIRPYHGWVMAYDAANLKQLGAFCVTADG